MKSKPDKAIAILAKHERQGTLESFVEIAAPGYYQRPTSIEKFHLLDALKAGDDESTYLIDSIIQWDENLKTPDEWANDEIVPQTNDGREFNSIEDGFLSIIVYHDASTNKTLLPEPDLKYQYNDDTWGFLYDTPLDLLFETVADNNKPPVDSIALVRWAAKEGILL